MDYGYGNMNAATWLNKTVWCRLAPSHISGIGVFAIRDIPQGTRINEHSYRNYDEGFHPEFITMSVADFATLHPSIRSLILDRCAFSEDTGDTLRFMSPNGDQFLQSFMNHSDTPNSDGQFALRDIKEGEEITEDFRTLVQNPHRLTKKHYTFIW